MKQETLYQNWMESRRDVNLGAGFTDDVMREVHRLARRTRSDYSLKAYNCPANRWSRFGRMN